MMNLPGEETLLARGEGKGCGKTRMLLCFIIP
jgi:hypothetical protein